jgi:hypothetical protein
MMTTPYTGSSTWTSLAAYTGRFGNGLSATFSLEDAGNRTTGVMMTAPASTATGITWADGEAGRTAPEIVSNLRLDQAWGTAHNLNAYDVNVRQAGLNTIWSPMAYLDLGVEVVYSNVDGAVPLKYSGGSATSVPAVIYGGSANVWSGGVRAQLSF